MTQTLQATYITEFLQAITGYGLSVVIVYELGDGGSQLFGLMTANWAAQKPSYAAVQAIWASAPPLPPPSDKASYTAALLHIANRAAAMQSEYNAIESWLANPANAHLTGRAEVSAIAGWLLNETGIDQKFLKSAPKP